MILNVYKNNYGDWFYAVGQHRCIPKRWQETDSFNNFKEGEYHFYEIGTGCKDGYKGPSCQCGGVGSAHEDINDRLDIRMWN